jgi:hypothetical protein
MGLTGPAWKKQVASSVRLRDNKRCNPGQTTQMSLI